MKPSRVTNHTSALLATATATALAVACGTPAGNPALDAGRPGPADDLSTTEAIGPQLVYAPTCTDRCEPGCLAGTEVQALAPFDGRLYVGTSLWKETLACIHPARSAQVLALSPDGRWEAATGAGSDPSLPGACADGAGAAQPGIAAWEQVNHLIVAPLLRGAQIRPSLVAAVTPTGGQLCPGTQGTALYLAGDRWRETGLGAVLTARHGPGVQFEVRYLASHSDATADCPPDASCLFAAVNPRGRGPASPEVWRARACAGGDGPLCWDGAPELALDGASAPLTRRIVAVHDGGSAGLFIGGSVDNFGGGDCRDPGSDRCARAVLVRRSPATETWTTTWRAPVGADLAVRGIQGWTDPDGKISLWWVTLPLGTMYRLDWRQGEAPAGQPTVEQQLVALTPCSKLYPYQIHRFDPPPTGDPILLVASQSCHIPRDGRDNSHARIFWRNMRSNRWSVIDVPSIVKTEDHGPNQGAVRWIATSPFDGRDVLFGTTDMNSKPGSLTARVYRLPAPFEGR